jgi:hypothetical protein
MKKIVLILTILSLNISHICCGSMPPPTEIDYPPITLGIMQDPAIDSGNANFRIISHLETETRLFNYEGSASIINLIDNDDTRMIADFLLDVIQHSNPELEVIAGDLISLLRQQ